MPKVIDENKNIIIINNPGIPFFLFSYAVYPVHKKSIKCSICRGYPSTFWTLCVIPFRLDVAALIIDNAFAA